MAPSFASLQLKKFELEFAVDPLFKKASADFDEGGAKGLLLNHLSIDAQGRIVFDSSDDVDQTMAERNEQAETEAQGSKSPTPRPQTADSAVSTVEVDLRPLAKKFFPDLGILSELDICPSLKNLDFGDESGTFDIPFLRAPEDWRQENPQPEQSLREASGIMLDDDIAIGFDDDDATVSGFDIGGDAGFGEGGEVWAREAALEPMLKVHRVSMGAVENNDGSGIVFDSTEDEYKISLTHQPASRDHENILSYFDNALRKDWAGPEHWKIRRIKETVAASNSTTAPRQRKEKEPFEINFTSPLDPAIAEMIYAQTSSNSAISLPKTQWKTKGRNLLPDDKHFNSKNLLRLFLKPKARMGSRSRNYARQLNNRRQPDFLSSNNGEMDEQFWASQKPELDPTGADANAAPGGAYDADFFADDDGLAFPHGLPMGDDDDDNLPFADAREDFSPPLDPNAPQGGSVGGPGGLSGINALLNNTAPTLGFGSQLVTQGGRRVRPEYVAYARVAKKVDVRRLKEVMWKGMGDRLIASSSFSSASPSAAVTATPSAPTSAPAPDTAGDVPASELSDQNASAAPNPENNLRFTEVMNSLQSAYPEQAMRDISTSYCFICLLHLANEKGLVLENKGGSEGDWDDRLEEVYVTRDAGAVIEGEV